MVSPSGPVSAVSSEPELVTTTPVLIRLRGVMISQASTRFASISFGLALNCSAITDFDRSLLDEEDASSLYSLAANIDNPVEVDLYDNGTASITLMLAEPLPEEDDDILLDLIDEGIVSLEVVNLDTLVSTNLTDGERLDDGSSPSGPGEYVLSLNDARDEVGVLFWNETEEGQSIRVDGSYRAIVDVAPNDYFATEAIIRSVVVSAVP